MTSCMSTAGVAGGVVGYSVFDNDSRYSSGNYTAVVLNSFSTTNSVTATVVGGVVGKVNNKNSKKAAYSTVENCYYDSTALKKVNAYGSNEDNSSTITTVVGKTTADMNTNSDFVRVLNTQNGKIDYTFVWLFEDGNYPVLDFSGCAGNYKITFVVNGEVVLEATTVKGKIVEATVADPKVTGAVFRGWKDDHGNVLTSAEAQAKFYTRAVTYNAVLHELFEITFVTSFGKELGKKSFEKGSMVFYFDEENDSEIPADFETESASFKFTGWDKPFAVATENTTYTALYDEIAKAFPVRFFVQGDLYDSQFVAVNTAAVAPADPVAEGFRFDGWSEDFSKITAALDIDAKMVKTYNFCYFNLADNQCETVDEGTEVELPEVPENDSTKCSDWMIDNEVVEGSTIVVTGDISLSPKCELKQFNVAFVVVDSSVSKQVVTYGNAAEDPGVDAGALFDIKGTVYKFNNWIEDFSRVTADLDVNADVTRQVKVCFGENCEYVDEGSEITVPENSDPEDQNCEGWVNGETVYMPGDAFTAGTDMLFDEVCTVKQFAVTFLVKDSTVNTQVVAFGSAAEDPGVAQDSLFVIRDTIFKFNKWNEDFSNVTDALDVTADVTRQVEVCFGDNCELVDEDTEVTIPENSDPEGQNCEGWLNGETVYMPGETVFANENMQFDEVCAVKTFAVTFSVKDSIVSEQTVDYGAAAEDPGIAKDSLFVIRDTIYKFNKWNEDFSNVTDALDVTADVTRQVEVCFVTDTTVCDTVDAGSEITIPETPTPDSLDCDAWMNGEVALLAGDKITVEEMTELEARCTVKNFNVKFIVRNEVKDEQSVAYGAAATTPASPVAGDVIAFEDSMFIFKNWIEDYSNVTADLDVNANLVQAVEVCVVALGEAKCDTVPAGDSIDTPDLPSSDDSTCVEWTVDGEVFSDSSFLASEVPELVAKCLAKEYDVKFVAFDTVLVDSQRVALGQAAVAPDSLVPVFEGYRFNDWDADFTAVESNMVVNAVFDTLVKVTITADVGISTLDTSFYVLKDTTFTGLKSMIDSLSGEYFVCEDITVNGEALADTIVATEDLAVAAKCALVTHTVTYYVDEKVVGTEIVAHGFAAKGAKGPEVAGKFFVKWDKDLHNVVEDIKTNGIYSDVELDTIKVIANGKAIDSIVVAKGDSAEYVLPKIKDTKDSTFLGWKVGDKLLNAGDTIIVKFNDKNIVASFEASTALRNVRALAGFSVHSANGQVQVIGARIGDELSVLDLQGRVIVKKPVMNSVELVNVTTRGSYLVRVGAQTKRVTVR